MNSTKAVGVSSSEITTTHINDFFDKLLRQIEEDKNSMLLGIADKEKAEMYENFITGKKDVIESMQHQQYSYKVITNMFSDYINELLKNKTHLPEKLALTFDTNSINIFAIIKDGDRETSKNLILSESYIIPKYHPKGFKMNTIIFEESDSMNIPKGYKEFDFSQL